VGTGHQSGIWQLKSKSDKKNESSEHPRRKGQPMLQRGKTIDAWGGEKTFIRVTFGRCTYPAGEAKPGEVNRWRDSKTVTDAGNYRTREGEKERDNLGKSIRLVGGRLILGWGRVGGG